MCVLSLLMVFMPLAVPLTTTCEQWSMFTRGRKMDYTLRRIFDVGPYRCMRECLTRRSCRAINYNQNKLMCELIYDISNYRLLIDDDFKFIKKDLMYNMVSTGDCNDKVCSISQKCDILADGTTICTTTECELNHFPFMTVYDAKSVLLEIGSIVNYTCNDLIRSTLFVTLECQTDGTWFPVFNSPFQCECARKKYHFSEKLNICLTVISKKRIHANAKAHCETKQSRLFLPSSSEEIKFASQLIAHSAEFVWIDGKTFSKPNNVHVQTWRGNISKTDFPKEFANILLYNDSGCLKMHTQLNEVYPEYNCDAKYYFVCEFVLRIN